MDDSAVVSHNNTVSMFYRLMFLSSGCRFYGQRHSVIGDNVVPMFHTSVLLSSGSKFYSQDIPLIGDNNAVFMFHRLMICFNCLCLCLSLSLSLSCTQSPLNAVIGSLTSDFQDWRIKCAITELPTHFGQVVVISQH